MFAVIRTGGKQYRVAKDDTIVVEKLAGDPGTMVELSEVLMIGEMVVLRSKLAKFSAQAYVDGERVFDGTIVGMKI